MTKTWYPMIDENRCIGCKNCHDMCRHNVFKVGFMKTRPKVVNPDGCVQGCHGCGRKCPTGAISYFGDDGGTDAGCGCSCQ